MIDMLKDELNLFDEMKRLANKDSLTEIEQSRFNRLSSLLKASDANKTRDMINKLIGSYSAEKVDITSMGERISINLNLGNESENRDKSDTDQ
jgi:hypothetical protein